MKLTLTVLAAVLILSSAVFSAGVPNIINYQGKLTDAAGDPVPDAGILVKFTIYDAAVSGAMLWNSGFQSVSPVGGLFSYDLGSAVVLPDLFGTDSIRYLGITVGADPEISPRSRFTSSGYVFRSQKSDLALDSDSLGGFQPSFFLAWGNMTGIPSGFADGVDDTASSIDWTALTGIPSGFSDGVDDTASSIKWTALTSVPAGFADGTDDEGIDLATGDTRYLQKLGDTLKGNLEFDTNNDGVSDGGLKNSVTGTNLELSDAGNLKSRLWGESFGEVELFDANGSMTARLAATATSGGRLSIRDNTGTETISMLGGQTGNSSVTFPTGAISSLEMFDEPGLATNIGGSAALATGTSIMVDIQTVSITIPSDGYIMVDAQCYVMIRGSTGGGSAVVQIDEGAGGSFTSPYFNYCGFESGYTNIGPHIFPMNTSRVYFKSAGTYTFRLEGRRFLSDGSVTVGNARITAVFYPTAYGSITTIAEQPGDHPNAEAITLTELDGSTRTAYKMDLRYYEEKARQAEIKAQTAELEKLKAQTRLERARATTERE